MGQAGVPLIAWDIMQDTINSTSSQHQTLRNDTCKTHHVLASHVLALIGQA